MNKSHLSDAERAALVARIQRNYDYDDSTGKLVNKKTGKVVMGKAPTRTNHYLKFRFWYGRTVVYIYYHHAVWAWHHGRFPTQIDHIDGDSLNNRIGNLREVTPSENNCNIIYPWVPNSVTGLPGVEKMGLKYRVYIRGRRFSFDDKHQAFVIATLCGKRYSKGKNVEKVKTYEQQDSKL